MESAFDLDIPDTIYQQDPEVFISLISTLI